MYNPGTAVLNATNDFKLQARITGTVNGVAFTDANIVGGSFSINNQCSSDTELLIGQVYVGELNITLTGLSLERYSLYGKQIIPTYSLYAGDTWHDIPLGVFNISEVEITNAGVDIRAYDNMSLFDVPFAEASFTGTPYALASAACTACGLTLATTQTQFNAFANHGVALTATQTTDADGNKSIPQFSTYRDVIAAIAQVSCCNVIINRLGEVVFKPYPSTAVATIDTAHRKMGGMTADFETYYDGIIVTDPTTKAQTKYTRSNPTGLTMDLGDNPFINTEAIRNAILNGLTFRFHPFKMSVLNAPLYDLMDCVYLPDGVGDGTKLYCISKYTWTYHGSYQIVGTGQDPKLVAVTSSAQRTAQQAAQIAAQKVSSDEMDAAIESATAQITGNNGGYIVWHDSNQDGQPDELLVMDTPSIETAVKVWRFNKNGLGFSATGYDGEYALAMTADGAIVADMITVGTLSATLMRAGILKSLNYDSSGGTAGFSMNMETGEIFAPALVISAKNYTDTEVANALATAAADATSKADAAQAAAKSYTDTQISVIPGQIQSAVTETKAYADGKAATAESNAKSYTDTKDAATRTYVSQNYSTITQTANQISTAVSSIQIGGTNLLHYTADYPRGSSDLYWYASGTGASASISSATDFPISGLNHIIRVTNTGSSTSSQIGIAERNVPGFVLNEVYSEGCWVRASVAGLTLKLQPAWNGTASQAVSGVYNVGMTTTSWQYIKVEGIKFRNFSTTDAINAGYVYMAQAPAGSWLEVCGSKLELGNKATDWSPNPEDLEEYTDNAVKSQAQATSSQITQLSDRITSTVSTVNTIQNNMLDSSDVQALIDAGNFATSSSVTQTSNSLQVLITQAQNTANSANSAAQTLTTGVTVDSNGVTVGKSTSAVKGVFSNNSLEFQSGGKAIAWLSANSEEGLGVDTIQIGDHNTANQRWIVFTSSNGSHLSFTRHQ